MKTTVITSAKANGQNINPAITAKVNTPSLGGNVAGNGDDKVNGLPLGKDLAEGNAPVNTDKPQNSAVVKPEENKTEDKVQEQDYLQQYAQCGIKRKYQLH